MVPAVIEMDSQVGKICAEGTAQNQDIISYIIILHLPSPHVPQLGIEAPVLVAAQTESG